MKPWISNLHLCLCLRISIFKYIYIYMYTETICNVLIKVFFLFGDFDNEMPAVNFREEKIRHQIWSNDQIRWKLEKLKQKNISKNISEFWDDKCFSSTMGCFTVAHLTSYLEAKSGSAVASTCPNSWGSHGDGKTKRTQTPSAFARTVLAPSIPGTRLFPSQAGWE